MINSDKFARLRAKLQGLDEAKPILTAFSTSKVPNVHKVNKQVEGKLTETRPTSEVVADLQRKAFVEEEWIPDAYVIFTRRWQCKCGLAGTCMDRPELFLRHRHIRQRKVQPTLAHHHDTGLRYKPVKVLVLAHLPRLKEVSFRSLTVCEVCFEKTEALNPKEEVPVWQKSSPSPQEDIATSGSTSKEPEVKLDQSDFELRLKRPWSMEELERDLSQYASMGLNLDLSAFASSSSEISAPAEDTAIHIEEGQASA